MARPLPNWIFDFNGEGFPYLRKPLPTAKLESTPITAREMKIHQRKIAKVTQMPISNFLLIWWRKQILLNTSPKEKSKPTKPKILDLMYWPSDD